MLIFLPVTGAVKAKGAVPLFTMTCADGTSAEGPFDQIQEHMRSIVALGRTKCRIELDPVPLAANTSSDVANADVLALGMLLRVFLPVSFR